MKKKNEGKIKTNKNKQTNNKNKEKTKPIKKIYSTVCEFYIKGYQMLQVKRGRVERGSP